jgi:site-specific DNA-cytosine methylase
MKRLPAELSTMLVGAGGFDGTVVNATQSAPCFTITANQNQKDQLRAFIVGGANTSDEQAAPGVGVSQQDEPTRCVNANNSNNWKAFIVGDQRSHNGQQAMVRDAGNPVFVIDTRPASKNKAFITDSLNYSSINPNRFIDEPAQTVVVHSSKHPAPRAWLDCGKVVKMTPRCLARFQSLPDWYELPVNDALACKIIGNGFPCLMAQRVFEQFV